jgi:hypothetical protein
MNISNVLAGVAVKDLDEAERWYETFFVGRGRSAIAGRAGLSRRTFQVREGIEL